MTPLGGLLLVSGLGAVALMFFYLPKPWGTIVGVPGMVALGLLWFGGAFIPPR